MNLSSRLEKLEQIQIKARTIVAMTIKDSTQARLSTGEVVSLEDLNKYRNVTLILFEFDPNRPREQGRKLRLLSGDTKQVSATTLARLIVACGGTLADIAEAL